MKKTPDPVDRHVGSRVRIRRVLVGMSQERLGDALGLTFQQVQKYEKGVNRIGASRLQQIAGVLDVSPAFFFDALDPEAVTSGEDSSDSVLDFLSTAEGLSLNRSFIRIADPKIRRKIVELVVSLAQGAGPYEHADPAEEG